MDLVTPHRRTGWAEGRTGELSVHAHCALVAGEGRLHVDQSESFDLCEAGLHLLRVENPPSQHLVAAADADDRGSVGRQTGEGGAEAPASAVSPPGEAETPPAPPAPPAAPPPPREPPAEPPPAPAPAPEPAPAPAPEAGAAGAWIFDDAENPDRCASLWGDAAAYVQDSGASVIRINFAAASEEDWGEYGKQRVVFTRPPARNTDLRPYRYLALHMKADREMEVVLTLVTLPDPGGPRDQPHFGFTAYLHPPAGEWKTVTLDLGKLELAVEGEGAYEKAGSPPRPNDLSILRFVTNSRNAGAAVLVDDVTFHRDLPDALRSTVLEP